MYADKKTGLHKGFGFVSFQSVVSAQIAIQYMNGFQIANKRLKVEEKQYHKKEKKYHLSHLLMIRKKQK